jgi:translocation and assembly module TamB
VVDLAAQLSGGVVGIERPEGYLLGQLKLGALHVRTPTLQVDVVDLTLDWRPGAFASRGLDVALLTAADVQVATAPSDEPTVMPASLELPAAVHVGASRSTGCVSASSSPASRPRPISNSPASQAASIPTAASHRLDGLRLSAPFGQLAGQLDLDGRKPFPLSAQAVLTTRQAGEPYTVAAGAAGDLESWCSTPASAAPASMAGR